MGGGRRGALWVGLVLMGAGLTLAQEDAAARVKKAQEAARANAATAAGETWKKDNSHAIDRLMILVVNRCLTDPGDDIPTAFSAYLRLMRAGRAQEVLTDLDPSLGQCMTTAARDLPFPEAPRDDYWVEVNLAAPL